MYIVKKVYKYSNYFGWVQWDGHNLQAKLEFKKRQ